MSVPRTAPSSGEGRVWGISLLVSLVLNALLFFTFCVIDSKRVEVSRPRLPERFSDEQLVKILIVPERSSTGGMAAEPFAPVSSRPDRFARTSADQASAPPEVPAFIGERDTQASSDRTPDPTAEAMPAQTGIVPVQSEPETTESRYEDGEIGDAGKSKPTELAAQPPTELPSTPTPPLAEKSPAPLHEAVSAAMPAPQVPLAQGPNPIDVPVPSDLPTDALKPPSATRAAEADSSEFLTPKSEVAQRPPEKSTPADQAAGFKGQQRKTQMNGSISRTGKSALAVENTAMGRYQSALSRAVEQEWQRNCVRYRDYITPGFLTVRFVVEQNGKVRSVAFVGAIQSTEVQKGFTLNSIRQAGIPVMPADLKKELGTDPLELIFNFYF